MAQRIVRGAALLAGLWLLVYSSTFNERVTAAAARQPSLLLLLVVDQMRADYVDRFQHQWQGGLKRMLTTGASFRFAEYPYANTVTCAGHATISTGLLPSSHGLVGNSWFDRDAAAPVACTADGSVSNVGYGRSVTGGDSLRTLRATTLADELRAQLDPPGHALALSLKARSAITLAGRAPDAVTWFDDSGAWATSSAFASAPSPVLRQILEAQSVDRDFGRTWERALAPGRYLFDAPALGAAPAPGIAATFPHLMTGAGNVPDATFYQQWQSSPLSDEYLARTALKAARGFKFDRAGSTNLLAISFSALDRVGHEFGPQSHEVQDVLIRLDRTLATLFDGLDALVGPGNYTVALSADHGVAPIPERALAEGLPAGRLAPEQLGSVIDAVLVDQFGPGQYVVRVLGGEVYLKAGVASRLEGDPPALRALRAAMSALSGVDRVFTASELEATPPSDTSLRGRYARSHYPGRSGDLTVVLRPYWLTEARGTSHGTSNGYDTRVPLLLMGAGIRPGMYVMAAGPEDIAPTLAHLAGVTLPRTDGRVLSEALGAPEPPPPTN